MITLPKRFNRTVQAARANTKILFLDADDNIVKTKDQNGDLVILATSTDIDNTTPYTYKSANYTIQDADGVVECNGTFEITLPTLATITHNRTITVINSGAGIITIQTTGNELLGDVEQFELYPQESLSFQKGNTTYIVK